MKKCISIVLSALMLVGLLLMLPQGSVSAKELQPTVNGVAPNDWSGGTEVPVDLTLNPAPDWLDLKSAGVKVTEATTICHDFRGYQFYWTPEIRMLEDGKWVKVPSTGNWVPNEEGKYVVCADVTKAGVYALFGFYYGPARSYTPPV